MTSASLNKMSVRLDGNTGGTGLLMPKLKYRFRVTFVGFGTASEPNAIELTKQVMSFARPNPTFEEISLPIYNSTLKLAGKHSWPDVACELRDDAGGNVSQLVGQQLQKQMDFIEQASAASGLDYKFTTKCEVLDGGNGAVAPVVLETWELYGCYLKNADFGGLNYGESAPVTINLTISFDNASVVQSDTSVGWEVGNAARNAVGTVTATG